MDGSPDMVNIQVQRFWLLDNVRGFASLSVVAFHYQHFYFSGPGTLAPDFDRSTLPFYSILAVFYNMGYNAVQLFFVLSGFIFFFVYYEPLFDRGVTGFQYFVARFSRLYPLHAATLLLVAMGQWISIGIIGHFTVYPCNDAYHFILHMLFASHWGLQLGESFNGPVWSLSVEVVVYLLFFLYVHHVARHSYMHLGNALIVLVLLLIAWRLLPTSIGVTAHAASCFFAGGLAFFACARIAGRKHRQRLYSLVAIGVGLVVALLLFIATNWQPVLHFLVFPTLVLFLGVVQVFYLDAGKRFRFLGDISYSTYLWHFPLQLYAMIVTAALGLSIDYGRSAVFISFLLLLLGVSTLSFFWLERPAQYYLRKKMIGQRHCGDCDGRETTRVP